ncbi:MAG: WGR domain-containing protein [Chthoniobacter sp.]|uniref:ATP-dependent DNA ligase n=1 Tax=Chthoniobacter sp. TaxID=2510640 RepID=UPI0032A82163
MEHTTLYFKQGSSDKVYQASIAPQDGGYVVQFAYGRRGATLQTGTKTQMPVPYDEAKRLYDKLVAEKTAKGYAPGEDGTPYHGTDKAGQATGIQCQLLNSVEVDQVERLISDPAYWMQEKHDGRRLLVRKTGDAITGINRLGLAIALPQSLVADVAKCSCDLLLDGEAIGETLHAFDVLFIGGEDVQELPYNERYLRLMNLLASFQHRHIQLVHTVFLHQQKAALFHQLKTSRAEGVVFKRTDAPYTAGRPASGGPQIKHKFCATASFIVGKTNAKRSVSLLLFNGDRIGPAGNVTIPANHEIPQAGQVVECRYLYAFRESGSIYQAVYLGTRDDIRGEECTTDQLKYRREESTEEAA